MSASPLPLPIRRPTAPDPERSDSARALPQAGDVRALPVDRLRPAPDHEAIYGPLDDSQIADLVESLPQQGLLEPLLVAPAPIRDLPPRAPAWEIVAGHRRLAAARALGWPRIPCRILDLPPGAPRRRALVESNRQRRKTYTQLMREADALHELLAAEAKARSLANLQVQAPSPDEHDPDRDHDPRASTPPERRNSDAPPPTGIRAGRTDDRIAKILDIGGKDLYRQARAVWKAAAEGDPRALAAVRRLDAGTQTVHAAHKDLRRRDRYANGFKPTPYDVWNFRHDPAFGVGHPGAIPAGIVAHALHYFTAPGELVVDPMAGGGTTLDVALSMGRRCLAYDLAPVRPEIRPWDIRRGFPDEASGCDLVFCDPPYFNMLADRYPPGSVSGDNLADWLGFLRQLARSARRTLRPGGRVAILLANQTEKDLPPGHGYLDHAFFAYQALVEEGFLPERRVSCPMSGGYHPQQVRRARSEGRMLGLVRDLLVARKPTPETNPVSAQRIGLPPANS